MIDIPTGYVYGAFLCVVWSRIQNTLYIEIHSPEPSVPWKQVSLKHCGIYVVETGSGERGLESLEPLWMNKGLTFWHISQSFQSLVKDAVDSTYNELFFENVQTGNGYQKHNHAVVQNLNMKNSQNTLVNKVITVKPSRQEMKSLLIKGHMSGNF